MAKPSSPISRVTSKVAPPSADTGTRWWPGCPAATRRSRGSSPRADNRPPATSSGPPRRRDPLVFQPVPLWPLAEIHHLLPVDAGGGGAALAHLLADQLGPDGVHHHPAVLVQHEQVVVAVKAHAVEHGLGFGLGLGAGRVAASVWIRLMARSSTACSLASRSLIRLRCRALAEMSSSAMKPISASESNSINLRLTAISPSLNIVSSLTFPCGSGGGQSVGWP